MSKSQVNLFSLFGDPWALRIVDALGSDDCKRFVELRERLNEASPTTLSKKLKLLVDNKIVIKTTGENHLEVRYALTDKGRDMLGVVQSMKRFFEKYGGPCE